MFKKIAITIIAVIALLPAISMAQTQQSGSTTTPLTADAALCTDVQERVPVGEAQSFPADVGKVFLWCRISGAGQGETTISHIWFHDGKEMANIPLPIKGDLWRTWSFKTIPPEWAGNWEVRIVGPDGAVIKSVTFTVGEQPKPVQP